MPTVPTSVIARSLSTRQPNEKKNIRKFQPKKNKRNKTKRSRCLALFGQFFLLFFFSAFAFAALQMCVSFAIVNVNVFYIFMNFLTQQRIRSQFEMCEYTFMSFEFVQVCVSMHCALLYTHVLVSPVCVCLSECGKRCEHAE